MTKKLNKLLNSSIFISSLLMIIGIIFILFPQTSIHILAYLLSVLLLGNGIYLIILEFKMRELWIPIDTLLTGILSILFGILLFIYPSMLQIMIPVILGSWFILTSFFKLRITLLLKKLDATNWLISLLFSILSIICGMILIIDPLGSSITITLFLGIIIMIYSVSDIIDMILFKKHLRQLTKYFNNRIKIIDE